MKRLGTSVETFAALSEGNPIGTEGALVECCAALEEGTGQCRKCNPAFGGEGIPTEGNRRLLAMASELRRVLSRGLVTWCRPRPQSSPESATADQQKAQLDLVHLHILVMF